MIAVLTILICTPPLLSLMACARRRARVVSRGGSGQWSLMGMIVSVAILLLNLAILVRFDVSSAWTFADLGRPYALALGLSWLCFWIWLYVVFAFRRRRVIY
jgi:hypothetical protein